MEAQVGLFDGRSRCVWLGYILVSNMFTHNTLEHSVTTATLNTLKKTRFSSNLHIISFMIHNSSSACDIWAVSSAKLFVVNAYHDGEDQSQKVDGVCRTKTGENSQTKVAAERRWRLRLLYTTLVKKCTPTQGIFHLCV